MIIDSNAPEFPRLKIHYDNFTIDQPSSGLHRWASVPLNSSTTNHTPRVRGIIGCCNTAVGGITNQYYNINMWVSGPYYDSVHYYVVVSYQFPHIIPPSSVDVYCAIFYTI